MPKPDLHIRYLFRISWAVLISVVVLRHGSATRAQSELSIDTPSTSRHEVVDAFVEENCVYCHNVDDQTAGLALEDVRASQLTKRTAIWEKIVRKLHTRQMPPAEMGQPDEEAYQAVVAVLESALDRTAAESPNPGRTSAFRRLTRTEYQNAIRDLLALEINAAALLPMDQASHGFDNVTVSDLSPTLLSRYVSAAQKISRLAIGRVSKTPHVETFRLPPDLTQEEHMEGLPLGTRGGGLFRYTFPQDGEYEVQIRLTRDRDEHVEGLNEPHDLDLLMDRRQVESFTVKPPRRGAREDDPNTARTHADVDRHLKSRLDATAGPHELGVAFVKQSSSLLETERQPLNVHYNMYRHPRLTPAVYQVTVTGPFSTTGAGDTPSRRRIFSCRPTTAEDHERCAVEILSNLMRRAYRRPIGEDDLAGPMQLFRQTTADVDIEGADIEGGFEAGIEAALSAVLVNPNFLFRIELDPPDVAPHTAYRISDLELASRLSFFLWGSIPDEELLELAIDGKLSEPEILQRQTRRMLADQRAESLVESFAGQWLYLRNLDAATPDMRLFPDFGENLRQALRRETELLFDSVMREDLSVLNLLDSDYTYLNQRLAKHYNVPHVYGSRFRRVALDEESRRGGLLRHGSILTVTSYATRTSPVIRGKWILENLLGTPPPPPPENVPALEDNTVAANLSVRERLAAHRDHDACASCHALIDPPGFSLENFDAVGQWREMEGGQPVDASGGLPDGSEFTGVAGLEEGLLKRPELFVGTMTEKLLTYALGRGVEHYDAPAVRKIVRDAKQQNYGFSSLILGVIQSEPFQKRMSQ